MQQNNKNIIHQTFAKFFQDGISANIAYLLSKELEDGNICVDISELNNDKSTEHIYLEDIKKCPNVSTGEEYLPFVLHGTKLYLQKYYFYETLIIDKIVSLIECSKNENKEKIRSLLELKDYIIELFQINNQKINNPWQLVAALRSLLYNFNIIIGGPGTGKTTTITKILILQNYLNPKIKIAIAAPTGKAASRLNESLVNTISSIKNIPNDLRDKLLNIKATTVHRLLKVNPHKKGYFYNSDNMLRDDLIIIDESSMIDVSMMSSIMSAISTQSKLVLVGDKNQLNSIEAGSIFGDFSKIMDAPNTMTEEDYQFFSSFFTESNSYISDKYISNDIPNIGKNTTELLHSYRFDKDSDIGKFSDLINKGIYDEKRLIKPFKECDNSSRCVKIVNDISAIEFDEYLKYYEEIIREEDLGKAFDKLGKIKILCSVVDGTSGVKHYNDLVENYLKNKKLIAPRQRFYDGQNIMITTNDYSLGLYNGDIGIVRKSGNELFAYFRDEEGIIQKYPVSSINNFDTVYAMTIHKSQGSEYENVIIILPKDKNHQLLSREMLYTAITRAKKNVIIVADDEVVIQSVKRKVSRISGIKERLSKF